MLDNVRYIGPFAVDTRFFQSAVKKASGWTDKRAAFQVLFVSRDFADEHELRWNFAFAENGLRAYLIQIAASAIGRCVFQIVKSDLAWKEIKRASLLYCFHLRSPRWLTRKNRTKAPAAKPLKQASLLNFQVSFKKPRAKRLGRHVKRQTAQRLHKTQRGFALIDYFLGSRLSENVLNVLRLA